MSGPEERADYHLTLHQVQELKGTVLMPDDLRQIIINRYARAHGWQEVVKLFSQFIGLANSVVANNREMIEMFAITDCNVPPERVHQVNLPTIFGALCGVELASLVPQRKTCSGCAYRLGTPANQSPVTTCDADYCAEEGQDFMCHQHLDERGEPTRRCAGHEAKKRVAL